jgi:hypothetical protein
MTRDDIIRMAREADIDWHKHWDDEENRLERFATLVAAAEREACAKLVEDKFDFCGDELTAAAAIRARGEK